MNKIKQLILMLAIFVMGFSLCQAQFTHKTYACGTSAEVVSLDQLSLELGEGKKYLFKFMHLVRDPNVFKRLVAQIDRIITLQSRIQKFDSSCEEMASIGAEAEKISVEGKRLIADIKNQL